MSMTRLHPNRKPHNWLVYNKVDRLLKKHSQLYKGKLYNLGCGELPYREFFLKYASQYVGVDWAGSYHKILADIVADLNQPLPIESAAADTVVSLSVMEHLSEPQTMLNEAFRILKEGGVMVLQVPWQWQIHEAPYDFFRYTPYGLKNMLETAGFEGVIVEAQSGFFTTWVLKANYFSSRFVRGPKLVQWLAVLLLLPLWTLGQLVAPILDKLDRHWELESAGYFVIARKSLLG